MQSKSRCPSETPSLARNFFSGSALRYEKPSCDQKGAGSPTPTSTGLVDAARALPQLNHRPLLFQTRTPFPSRSRLLCASPAPDNPAPTPDGVFPADLISPSPTQFSLCFGNVPPPSPVQKPLPLYISPLGTTFSHLCIAASISFQMSSANASLFGSQFWKEKRTELIKPQEAFWATVCTKDHTK